MRLRKMELRINRAVRTIEHSTYKREVEGIYMTFDEIKAAEPNKPGLHDLARVLGGLVYTGVSEEYHKNEKGHFEKIPERNYIIADLHTRVLRNLDLQKPTKSLSQEMGE